MSGLLLAGPQKRYIAHAGFVTSPRFFHFHTCGDDALPLETFEPRHHIGI